MNGIDLVKVALSVVTDRLITILALVMCCGLTCYTLWAGDWVRVGTLAIFTLFSYLVVRRKDDSSQPTKE